MRTVMQVTVTESDLSLTRVTNKMWSHTLLHVSPFHILQTTDPQELEPLYGNTCPSQKHKRP